jgi:hypothetical protein
LIRKLLDKEKMVTTAGDFKKRKRLAVIMAVLCLAVLCTILLVSAPAKKVLFSNGSISIEVPADWKVTVYRTNGKIIFKKDNVIIGGITRTEIEQVKRGLLENDKYRIKSKKEIKGMPAKATLENQELVGPSPSEGTYPKNEICLRLLFPKERIAYSIYVDTKYAGEKQLVEIGKSFKRAKDKSNIPLMSEKARRLRIDYIGLNRSTDIVDAKRIKQTASFINTIDLEPLSEEEQFAIMASSAGGIRITPDNKNGYSIFVYGMGAIMIPATIKSKLGFKTDLCRITKSDTRKLFEMLQWPESP